MNLNSLFVILIVLIFGVSSNAAEYVRQAGVCEIRGTQQDIDTPEFKLPFEIQANMNMVFIRETGVVVKNVFSGWLPDQNATTALPIEVLNRLNAVDFRSSTIESRSEYFGQFSLIIPELYKLDLLEVLKHLGGSGIDLSSPYVYSDFSVSRSPGHGSTEKFISPFKLGFDFGAHTSMDYEIQIHLAPTIQNGLSFHLKIVCAAVK